MNLKLLIASVIFSAGFIAGCAVPGQSKAPDGAQKAAYEQAVKDAKSAIKQAASMGHEWRDSGKFLKDAAKAADAGDYDKAIKLANKAKREGELGYKQALAEKNSHPPAVLQ